MPFFDPISGGFYSANRDDIPPGAVEISEELRLSLTNSGRPIVMGQGGMPEPAPPVAPTVQQMLNSVDSAADAARQTVAGDPLRAVEYDRARIEAEQFAAAGFQGNVPPMVAAWAINGRTPQQAAESILQEAAQYTDALVHLRTVRLNAKELIRNAMATGNIEQAQDIAFETIASIKAAVAGIGNNAG